MRTLSIAMMCIAVAITAQPAISFAQGGWKQETVERGITVSRRPFKNSDIDIFKATTVLPYTTDQVIQVLSDIDSYKDYMPNTAESLLLDRTERSGREIITLYQRLDLPTVNDRDFIVSSETWSEDTPKGRIWRIKFASATSPKAPKPRDGVVRVNTVSGSWTLTPTRDNTATQLTVTRHIELGGNIPDFMVHSGIQDALVETLVSLNKRCRTVYAKSK